MARTYSTSFRLRAIAITLLLLVISGATFDPKLFVSGDNVDYLLLAQRVFQEGEWWGSPKFPPLLPILLAPVQALFGPGFIAAKILMVLMYAATGPFLLSLAERRFRPGWALVITLAALVSVPVVEYSHYVMSEIPFLLLSVVALALAERFLARRQEGGGRNRILPILPIALAAGAAFYTRTIGIVLLAAFPAVLLLQRRWRAMLIAAGVCALLLTPWIAHTARTQHEGQNYLEQVRLVNPYHPELGEIDLTGAVERLQINGRLYFCRGIPMTAVPCTYISSYSYLPTSDYPLPDAAGILVAAALGWGLWCSRRFLPATSAYAAAYLVVCLAWPPVWMGERFLVPLLPITFVLLASGLARLGAPLVSRWRDLRRAPAVALAIILLLAAHKLVLYAQEVPRYPTRWQAYFMATEWARDHLAPDELVLDRKPNMFEYVTGRRAISFPREADDEQMLAYLRRNGVTVVHVSSIPYTDVLEVLHPFMRRQITFFEHLWYGRDEPRGGYGAFLRFHPEGGLPERSERGRD